MLQTSGPLPSQESTLMLLESWLLLFFHHRWVFLIGGLGSGTTLVKRFQEMSIALVNSWLAFYVIEKLKWLQTPTVPTHRHPGYSKVQKEHLNFRVYKQSIPRPLSLTPILRPKCSSADLWLELSSILTTPKSIFSTRNLPHPPLKYFQNSTNPQFHAYQLNPN